MQLDDFIRPYAEKLQMFKKNVFQFKHAQEFLQKLCERNDINKMDSELTKCLLCNFNNRESEDRKNFIVTFIEAFKKYSTENPIGVIKSKTEKNPDSNMIKIDKDEAWGMKKTNVQKDNNFTIQKKFKIKNKEEEFPTLENLELVNRKKQFEVLDHHYGHKLEKGSKICFCMSSRHPLVGNCLDCGRIQCLQEGDSECIVCGNSLIKREDYLKNCAVDMEMKKAYNHKEKLLKFQSDFYSKLQIIDDFSDWYEISNNTWISQEHRQLAKKKDEEIDRIRDNAEFDYSINFKTLQITKVYEEVDEAKMKEDITNLFSETQKKKEKKETQPGAPLQCRAITENAIAQLNEIYNNQHKLHEKNIKSLSKLIDINTGDQIEEEMNKVDMYKSFSLMRENDNFINESVMCLSMHQPWASLLIEGFKRFEGREWDSDYRGVLWIHATSKKPEPELIQQVERECDALYGKEKRPNYPKRYPTSCLLGCVDVVDVVKRENYVKLIPEVLREKTDSKFLFVCKNPRKLEIPIKMPGQPNIYKIDDSVIERTKGKLTKVNTSWWPYNSIYPNLLEIPFPMLLKPEDKTNHCKKQKQVNKSKLINLNDERVNSLLLVQNLLTREKKENVLLFVESIKGHFVQHADLMTSPFINCGLSMKDEEGYLSTSVLSEVFKEVQNYFREDKKVKMNFELNDVKVDYIDWYGGQNFQINETNSVKVFIGNPLVMSLMNDYSDPQGKSIRFECGDVVYLQKGYIYAINQVLYDTSSKLHKMKQGVVVITFNLK